MSIWRKFLKNISTGTDNILPNPLGKWNDGTSDAWLAEWDWFITADTEFLYHRYETKIWHRHLKKHTHIGHIIKHILKWKTSLSETISELQLPHHQLQSSDNPHHQTLHIYLHLHQLHIHLGILN